MSTFMANAENIEQKWFLIDAKGKTLGRLASQLANRLRGKNKPEFTPHVNTSDFYVVINVEHLVVSGKKFNDKNYHQYSGYPGGMKTTSFKEMQAKHPERVIELAVKGMLPKGPLGRDMFRNLKVYAGSEHPHAAQLPEQIDI